MMISHSLGSQIGRAQLTVSIDRVLFTSTADVFHLRCILLLICQICLLVVIYAVLIQDDNTVTALPCFNLSLLMLLLIIRQLI